MPHAKGPNAYPTERSVLETALDSERGIRIEYLDPAAAWYALQRFNSIRAADRRASLKLFEADHPLYGRSIFESLTFYVGDETGKAAPTDMRRAKLNPANRWVYLTKFTADAIPRDGLKIEAL